MNRILLSHSKGLIFMYTCITFELMDRSKTVPTQFRLSLNERDFLSRLGKGNISEGLRVALIKAGYPRKSSFKEIENQDIKIRRNYHFEHEEYCYIRLENNRAVNTINVSVTREREMLERFGERVYFEEAILKSLFPLDAERVLLESIESIIDVTDKKVLWKKA